MVVQGMKRRGLTTSLDINDDPGNKWEGVLGLATCGSAAMYRGGVEIGAFTDCAYRESFFERHWRDNTLVP
jgi:hypothetical protein